MIFEFRKAMRTHFLFYENKNIEINFNYTRVCEPNILEINNPIFWNKKTTVIAVDERVHRLQSLEYIDITATFSIYFYSL